MRSAVAFAFLVTSVLAGCLEAVVNETVGDPGSFVPATAMAPDPASAIPREPGERDVGDPAILVPGLMLAWEAECPCPAAWFTALPGAGEGWLEVRVRWDGTLTEDLRPTLVAPGFHGHIGGERGFDDKLIRVWAPEPGPYTLAITGAGHAAITVRLGSLAVPDQGALKPNLVEMVIEGPAVGPCDEVERTEQGAVKCMRFGNGVGNPGHGPVQIRLTVDQAALALAPLDGRFSQEVRDADGSIHAHEVGPASFHATHGHWHYDGLALFELHKVDPATGLRGEAAASHGKSGFCFLDWDEMVEAVTVPAQQERAETDCLIPGAAGTWTNGISRGWYDFYESGLTDQYVDVDGLPDGLYELVASADPLKTLDELDETDNQSSLLIELKGGDVEVVEERGHYRVQDADDA